MKTCLKCGVPKKDSEFRARSDRPGKSHSRCKQCDNGTARKYRRKHTEISKAQNLKTCFGLSLEEWDEMNLTQGGMCAICACEDLLCVDHNHVTGKIRGLLCKKCNLAIGSLKDSVASAQAAADYLKKHS